MFIRIYLTFIIRLLIVFVLLYSVHGSSKTSHIKKKFFKMQKPTTANEDNRYVWFTRNIHHERQYPKYFQNHIHSKRSIIGLKNLLIKNKK